MSFPSNPSSVPSRPSRTILSRRLRGSGYFRDAAWPMRLCRRTFPGDNAAGHVMKLIVQPEGGIGPILTAISRATRAIDIVIFRLDCRSVTQSLEAAVRRGVHVR